LIQINLERCNGCGACVEVCPEGALYLVDNKAMVDTSLCRECESCVAACPVEAIAITSPAASTDAEWIRMPVPQPESQVIRVKTEPAPVPLQARVLPAVGAALSWAGREIVPRLATYLLDGLDRWAAGQTTGGVTRNGGSSTTRRGSGGQRRHRHRGGRSSST
jgi:NAD-dependent dihydropyrimidine dehydrogenase PreA subunit